MTQIAVLMTCHNRKDKTLLCLAKLFFQKEFNEAFSIKVFLVDDGSTDGTGIAVREKFPDVVVIEGDGNLYWNRGMYLSWNHALKEEELKGGKYDYYLWLNDDTFLFEYALRDLLECSKETGPNSIIVGTTCNINHNSDITYGGFKAINNTLIKPNGRVQECDYFNGNCVLISRRVVGSIGILDPSFHHALGDFDYSRRAKKSNIKLHVCYRYSGHCEEHKSLATWCSPTKTFRERIKALYSTSCEVHPVQLFTFEKRHHGLLYAIIHFFSVNLRATIPKLWLK